MAMEDDPAELVALDVRLRRVVLPDGRHCYRFAYTDGADAFEVLALLQAGVFDAQRLMRRTYRRATSD